MPPLFPTEQPIPLIEIPKAPESFQQKNKRLVFVLGAFFLFAILLHVFFLRAPADFPQGKIITVPSGITLSEASKKLYAEHLIHSPFLFDLFMIVMGRERGVVSGDYIFLEPSGLYEIARRISSGEQGPVTLRVTVPEGSTVKDIAELFSPIFQKFDIERFLTYAKKKEGYLFPDTYFFLRTVIADEVISRMNVTFKQKIATIQKDIDLSGKPLADSITMASIIEGEARTTESRKMVAGILWNRIELGMPLQVDASLKYLTGRGTADLTLEDLKFDSPYNTYTHRGLPPGPISNPGLDSILATLHPTKSNYLYFLTDKNGGMHYAKTFAEHVANKQKYLQ